MKARSILVLAVALAAFGTAGAAQSLFGSVDFRLDPMTDLARDANSRTPGSVGYWLTPNEFSGSTTVQYRWPDQSTTYLQESYSSRGMSPQETRGQPFGEPYALGIPALGSQAPTASSSVGPGQMHAGWTIEQDGDDVNVSTQWRRAFVLDPNSSVTLSGLVTLGLSLPWTPAASFFARPGWSAESVNSGHLSYYSKYSDTIMDYNGLRFVANILNRDPTRPGSPLLGREAGPDDFAYATDAQGNVSLTIFNHANESMFGSFEVLAYASAIPVPEPSMWAVMLAGLGVLAWRRRAAGAPPLSS